MITAIWDSFCRAIIRFFDNRFMPKQNTNFYEIEIARLHKLVDSFVEERRVPVVTGEVEDQGEMKPIMPPIETLLQRRARLERESRAEWERQLEEARSRIKTTEELEKSVGVAQ